MGGIDDVDLLPGSDIDIFPNPGGESDESSLASLLTFGYRPFSGGRFLGVRAALSAGLGLLL